MDRIPPAEIGRRRMKHAAILLVLIAGLLALVSGKLITTPYTYDEADYVFAASLGSFPNWWDTGSLAIVDFIRIGLGRGADPRQRLALSQLARDSKDPVVYRHWHGPLYYYWLAALLPWNLAESTVRGLSLVFPVVTAIVLYFGTLRLLPQPAAQPAAILACALFLWGQTTVKTTELAPHMPLSCVIFRPYCSWRSSCRAAAAAPGMALWSWQVWRSAPSKWPSC
jgi:hypothetical protein